jgi:glycosyltransferase involved in cell wall biosynthesis
MISVLILTRNEERDLPACLDSVAWSDDVHVFDSFSTDRTLDIARARGAAVAQRVFDDFAAQRNAALHGLSFRHPWTLILDADERATPVLAEECLRLAARAPARVAAGRIRRRDYLHGTWLRHAQLSPFYLRLVRPERVRYEREVNEVLKVDGAIVDLDGHFDHFPFSKGLAHWVAKHNLYSSLEAAQVMKSRRGEARFSPASAFLERDFNERRYHQKELFYRLPGRPVLKFLLIYVARMAFLDGRAGFTYAMLQAIYEYLIVLKTRELADQERTVVEPAAASPAAAPNQAAVPSGDRQMVISRHANPKPDRQTVIDGP